MIHKFCENHLVELYEAIKADQIGEIKRIEHLAFRRMRSLRLRFSRPRPSQRSFR